MLYLTNEEIATLAALVGAKRNEFCYTLTEIEKAESQKLFSLQRKLLERIG